MYARLLRDPRFAKLLAGQSISELGSAVTQIALPTIAVLVLHAGPFELGILVALQRIPFPILALFVGVWIDRLPRRRVMIVADVLRAAVLAAVPISYGAGFLGLPLLYAVSLTTGVLTIFFDLAYLSYVPELVDRERLSDANATLQMSLSVASLAGPGLGGLLIQAVGAARAVGIDSASFVLSFLGLVWMGPDKVRAERRQSPGMLKELSEGLGHVFAHPLLRTLIFTGLLDPIHNVTQWSLRQLLTPDHLQGRMNSIFRTVYWGAWPLGNLVGGYLGSVFGPRQSIFLGGLLFGSLSLIFLLGPLRKASLTVPAGEPKIETV